MRLLFKNLSAIILGFFAVTSFARPDYFLIHNVTNEELNIYIAGSLFPYPTPSYSSRQAGYVNMMNIGCYGRTVNDKCPISIKMTTDTNKIIDIGSLNLDLFKCNESTQTKVSNNGYTLAVVGPCEIRITKN